MHICQVTKDYGVIIYQYVDNMLIFGANLLGINETKKYLSSIFKIRDLSEVDTILGIKVKKYSKGYELNQLRYIEKLLQKFKHYNIKEANTPYDSSMKLTKNCDKVIA